LQTIQRQEGRMWRASRETPAHDRERVMHVWRDQGLLASFQPHARHAPSRSPLRTWMGWPQRQRTEDLYPNSWSKSAATRPDGAVLLRFQRSGEAVCTRVRPCVGSWDNSQCEWPFDSHLLVPRGTRLSNVCQRPRSKPISDGSSMTWQRRARRWLSTRAVRIRPSSSVCAISTPYGLPKRRCLLRCGTGSGMRSGPPTCSVSPRRRRSLPSKRLKPPIPLQTSDACWPDGVSCNSPLRFPRSSSSIGNGSVSKCPSTTSSPAPW
jgi:hypothetical protein